MKKCFTKTTITFFIFLLSVLLVCAPGAATAGDGEGRTRVAVFQWSVNAPAEHQYLGPALTDMITSRTGSDPNIEIESPSSTRAATAKLISGSITEEEALKVGELLSVEFVLYGSVTLLGESVSIDAKLLNVKTGEVRPFYASGKDISSVITMAGAVSGDVVDEIKKTFSAAKSVDIRYSGIFKGETPSEPATRRSRGGDDAFIVVTRDVVEDRQSWRSRTLNGFYQAMATADLDADGDDEFFLMSRNGVMVADFGPGGFVEKSTLPSGANSMNIYISSADIDGDGTSEVYVSALNSGVAETYLIEYSDGKYQKTAAPALNGRFARTVHSVNGEPPVLISQGFRPASGFFSKVVKVNKGDDGFSDAGVMKLPKSIIRAGLFGYHFFDFTGEGATELVRIGEKGYLEIYRESESGKWKRFWISTESYGGTLNIFDTPENTSDGDTLIFVEIRGDFKVVDLDNDGKNEIIVKKNNAEGFGKFAIRKTKYKDGLISSLSWDVANLSEDWRTKNISGYIADFAITDLNKDGEKEITLLVVDGTGRYLAGSVETSYLFSHGL